MVPGKSAADTEAVAAPHGRWALLRGKEEPVSFHLIHLVKVMGAGNGGQERLLLSPLSNRRRMPASRQTLDNRTRFLSFLTCVALRGGIYQYGKLTCCDGDQGRSTQYACVCIRVHTHVYTHISGYNIIYYHILLIYVFVEYTYTLSHKGQGFINQKCVCVCL